MPKKSSTGRSDNMQDASISTMRTLGERGGTLTHQGTMSSNDYANGTAPRNGKLQKRTIETSDYVEAQETSYNHVDF